MNKTYRNVSAKALAMSLVMRNGELVKLSNTTKLGTKSWSLQALNTCPASKNAAGELVDACKGCYASYGQYNYPQAQSVRAFNQWAWQQDSFIDDFVKALDGVSHFRWFDSGDLYSHDLAVKIWHIMDRMPNTRHWLPTRMYKFKKFHSVLNSMADLDNVCVRLSSDSIMGERVDIPLTINFDTQSTIVPENFTEGFTDNDKVFICQAPKQDGKCLSCRACYDKEINVIGYVGHGRVMKLNQQKLINVVSV